MAVLKMKAVTIVGQLDDFDRVVSKYVAGRDIHLENTMMVLEDTEKLVPYGEDNQYASIAKNVSDILKLAGMKPKKDMASNGCISKNDMFEKVNYINNLIEEKKQKRIELDKNIKENELVIKQLQAMLDFDVDLRKLFEFEFIKFRFGRIPRGGYKTLTTYLENIEAVFMKTAEDETDIWGFYFTPQHAKEKIDAIFSSLYFERIFISDKVIGTPKESTKNLIRENEMYQEQIKDVENEVKKLVETSHIELSDIYSAAKQRQMFADVKKYAAHSDEFFYIIGWMSAKQEKALENEIADEEKVIFITEESEEVTESVQTPTKLRNISIFRPFEMFVRMYGLPSYGEIDPTPIMAITYILLFGIMFGDVGQSALFAIAGFIIYKKTRNDLAAMISMVGVSGVVFGFAYGSIFGNETLLEGIRLISPMHKINFMLMGSVAMGVFIIVFCMIVNIINSIRARNWGKMLFGNNGVAGLMFYLTLIALILTMVMGMDAPVALMVAVLIITFLAMYLQEPLSQLLAGKKDWLPRNGMFYVESFFEMFDVLLSFVTNTISFLRVGAFAIIHVGMMFAVSILAGDGSGAILVKIIGNIVVMGLEGLIVGIQVLRLEYYEMFSRYFDGKGKEFKSLHN